MSTQTSALEALLWSSRRAAYPSAWHGHVSFVHWLVNALKPKLIVELGTEYGVSYAAMCHAVAALGLSTRCAAIDTWQGDSHTVAYDPTIYDDLNSFNERHYAAFSRLLRCTFDDAQLQFAVGAIDLLHIDGLHTYDAVSHDFRTWLPKMSEHGVVLFHDIEIRVSDFGVWRLWEELRLRYPSFQFSHSGGLGVLCTGGKLAPAMEILCGIRDPRQIQSLRAEQEMFSTAAQRNGVVESRVGAMEAKVAMMQSKLRTYGTGLIVAADS